MMSGALAKKMKTEAVIGYVQHVSPMKRNQKNTLDYASLTLQTGPDTVQQALLYASNKLRILRESAETRTPIKLQRFTYTPDDKIIINAYTSLSKPLQTECSFQYSQQAEHFKPMTVQVIQDTGKEWDSISFTGKVVHLGEESLVGVKKLRLVEAFMADSTGAIKVSLWQDLIGKVSLGKVYKLSPIQIRVWGGKSKLSATSDTDIDEVADQDLSNLPNVDVPESTITVNVPDIESVEKVETVYHCAHCSRRIIQTTASSICQCEYCGHTMRTSKCQRQKTARLVV